MSRKDRYRLFAVAIPAAALLAFAAGTAYSAAKHFSTPLHCILQISSALVFLPACTFLHIILHEAGHLAAGLASGYSFVSFRIFDLDLTAAGGKIRIARRRIPGTGGQCLMSPPEGKDINGIPVKLYLCGGITANILVTAASAAAYFFTDSWVVQMASAGFFASGAVLTAMNAIPSAPTPVPNDMHTLLTVIRDGFSRKSMICQLKVNAAVASGHGTDTIPENLFPVPEKPDYSNMMHVTATVIRAGYEIESGNFRTATSLLTDVLDRSAILPEFYIREIRINQGISALAAAHGTGNIQHFLNVYRQSTAEYARKTYRMGQDRIAFLCGYEYIFRKNEEEAEKWFSMLNTEKHFKSDPDTAETAEFIRKYLMSAKEEPLDDASELTVTSVSSVIG